MESTKKNMVILKNLPSNLIEEAIVILKENKVTKKYQYIEEKKQRENNQQKEKAKSKNYNVQNVNCKDKKINTTGNKQQNDYILKEAEMIISNYIKELETKSPKWKNNMKKLEARYKKSLKLNFILAFIALIGFLLSII